MRSRESSPVHLVSEPEAAAIFAMHGLDPHGLKVDESFVICDAGGGTVDLISYTITKLRPVLEVREAAPGTGGLCGSTFLNMRFKKFLISKLGKEDGFDDEVLAEAMERFEKVIKRQFTMSVDQNETYTIPVGGLANNKVLGINRGRYSLKAADVRVIFEPVVQEVIKLVRDQITTSKVNISAVLLVGGFGASNYLKERLRNAIDRKIQVLQPTNAWLAVVQGAMMKGLAQCSPQLTMVKVKDRKARKHYGTNWGTKFDLTYHAQLANQKYWDSRAGEFRVKVTYWFIRRGDNIPEDQGFTTSIRWVRKVSNGRLRRISTAIYADRTDRDAPLALDDHIQHLCNVEADPSHIPAGQLLKRKGADGKVYYVIDAQIEAKYLSASTQYTLIYNGQRYNTVTAEYV